MSGESAAAGASRRGGTQPWTGSWGEWGPPPLPPRAGTRLGRLPRSRAARSREGGGGGAGRPAGRVRVAVGGARASRWAREGRPPSGEAPAALSGAGRPAGGANANDRWVTGSGGDRRCVRVPR